MELKNFSLRDLKARLMLKSKRIKNGFESSWATHCRMFGDILEPAFKDDMATRLELTSALNLISAGHYSAGQQMLEKLFKYCKTDEDFAAWYFFMGSGCQKMGLDDLAALFYSESAKREPKFYMVYLMLAKCMHAKKQYDLAVAAYLKAIEEIEDRPPKDEIPAVNTNALLGSVHGNLASCLVMMRRYDDAEYELYEAESYDFSPPQLYVTWATLYAATDRKTLAQAKMAELKELSPELETESALRIAEIAEGKNPHFTPKKIDSGRLKAFWDWFKQNEERLRALAFGKPDQEAEAETREELYDIVDFSAEKPEFVFGREGAKPRLSLYDKYNLSLELWLGKLVDTVPAEPKGKWTFYSEH